MGQLTFQATLGGAVNLAGPNTAATTTFTLPAADGTAGQALQTNGSGTLSFAATSLTSGVTGTLPVANGGTGQTALSAVSVGTATNLAGGSNGTIPYQTASGTTAMLAVGTPGQLLQTNGAGAPTWITPAGGSAGGSTTQLQYNNAGAFGGISGVTTDGTRITASTTIGVGGATPSTSGSGITFPATQSASTNANTLDDYEEGTWTIGIPDHQGTATTFTRSGSYVKIGRVVYIIGSITPTNGTFGSYGRSTGLPFTVSVFGSGGMCNFTNLDTPGSLSFSTQSNPIAWIFSTTVQSGNQVIFSGFYLTAD
jgi:hypothetical protein